MGLETGTYVNDLNTANPTSTDPKSQGDDHLRLIKSVLKNTFAGFPGLIVAIGTEAQGATVNDYVLTVAPAPAAYTASFFAVFKATHTNTGAVTLAINALTAKALKAVDGSALEAGDIENGAAVVAFYDGVDFFLISGNDRAARAGDTYTGTHDMTGATLNVATQAQGNNSAKVASTAYVDAGLAAKANLDSPGLTGTPTAPTPALTDNSTKLATTAFVVQMAFQAALPAQAGNGGKFLTTDGASASWVTLTIPQPSVTRNPQTGAYTAVVGDRQKLIDWTGTTNSVLSFAAAATLGDGWYCWVRNSTVGNFDLTLDPNGAETIDGLTSYKMYPGEVRLVQCNGASFSSVVLNPFYKVWTSSDTFTKPPGYSAFSGLLWAGGASGAKSLSNRAGGGGGGGCLPFTLSASSLAASVAVTIAAGGSGVTPNNTGGNSGGNSSFGSATSYGGSGGQIGTSIVGGSGGPAGANISSQYPDGFAGGQPASNTSSGYGGGAGSTASGGGSSVYGGAGGGSIDANVGPGSAVSGGTSAFGGNGGPGVYTGGTSADGVAPGGGGGGCNSGTSGAGARGELRLWGVA